MSNMEAEGYMEHMKNLKNYQNHCQHIIQDVDNALEELDKLEKEVNWKLNIIAILVKKSCRAEWSYSSPALKDCRDFETSVCLCFFRALVRIPFIPVVIFFLTTRG